MAGMTEGPTPPAPEGSRWVDEADDPTQDPRTHDADVTDAGRAAAVAADRHVTDDAGVRTGSAIGADRPGTGSSSDARPGLDPADRDTHGRLADRDDAADGTDAYRNTDDEERIRRQTGDR